MGERVLTLAGTRPELIRLSAVVERLDAITDHVFVYSGQNADPELRDVFFDELGIRAPDVDMRISGGSFGTKVARMLTSFEHALDDLRPDRMLVLGDTDTALAAIVAARRGIPVFHMEAGNRCFDARVPEELNRRLVDHASTVLMPYTERSAEHLVAEGISRSRIVVTGNPIAEVIAAHSERIDARRAFETLGHEAGGYVLCTLHRAETVDEPALLARVLSTVAACAAERGWRVVMPAHPRTVARLAEHRIDRVDGIDVVAPVGFVDFLSLQRNAALVASDSGTVQEECVINRVPHIVLRDATERPEAIECGASVLSGTTPDGIRRAVTAALASPCDWPLPSGYEPLRVSERVVKSVLGHLPPSQVGTPR